MKIVKKISLAFIGILLSLVILEISLQIAGFTLITIKKYRNKLIIDPNTVTVLCLGESTTYNQWPPILQKILNKKSKNIKFNVVDEGAYAEKTTFLVNNIENWIKKYNPEIVIAMIGINDWKILPWSKNKYIPFESFFSKIKVYKIIWYIIDCIKSNKKYADIKNLEHNNFKDYVGNYKRNNEISNQHLLELKDFDKSLKKLFKENKNDYYHYQLFYKFKDIDYAEIYEILFNCDNESDSDLIFNSEIFSYAKNKISKIDEHEYNDVLFGGFAIKYLQDKKIRMAMKYFQKAEQYRLQYFNFFSQKNYYKLIDTCAKNNIKFIAMQYPNRSVKSLKKMLQKNLNYNEIIFVDNDDIFKSQLFQGKHYNDFFEDQFAGDFGHCTELGNTLIAENVAETILNLYN